MKRFELIALLHLAAIGAFFAVGAGLGIALRLELLTPAADLFSADSYNRLFTIHGMVMTFLVAIPLIPCVLGAALLPRLFGTPGPTFLRLNIMSFTLHMLGGLLILWVLIAGGVDTGWTLAMPPNSRHAWVATFGATAALVAAALAGISVVAAVRMDFAGILRVLRDTAQCSSARLFAWSALVMAVVGVVSAPFGRATQSQVAHLHYLAGSVLTAFLATIHGSFRGLTGRSYPEGWGRLAVLLIFSGWNVCFAPLFLLGGQGLPSRYNEYPPEFQLWNVVSSVGAVQALIGLALPPVYLAWSLCRGTKAVP